MSAAAAGATDLSHSRRRPGRRARVLGIDVSGADAGRGRARSRRRSCWSILRLRMPRSIRLNLPALDLLASRFGVMFFAEPALSPLPICARPCGPSGRAGIRLLAPAARQPVDHGAAPGRLQARAQAAAAGARMSPDRPRSPPQARVHRVLGEAGFTRIAMEPCALALDQRGRAAASMPRFRARSKSARRAGRWKVHRPRFVPRPPTRSARRSRRSREGRRCRS